MAFRIAKELGIVDVDGMLNEIPMRLFLEWVAYFHVEPFGEERDDLRTGILASTMANVMSTKGKSVPMDFMPFAKRPRHKMAGMIDTLRATAHANSGKVKKSNG